MSVLQLLKSHTENSTSESGTLDGRTAISENDSASPSHASETECNSQELLFPDLISRPVLTQMDGHRVSSDAGSLLIGQLDRSFGITRSFARCFNDRRNQDLIEHELLCLIRQRV